MVQQKNIGEHVEDSYRNCVGNLLRSLRFIAFVALVFSCLVPQVSHSNEGVTASNIMILIDNSTSMLNIVPEAPYAASTVYPCHAKEVLASSSSGKQAIVVPDLPAKVSAGIRFSYLDRTYVWGKTACFHPDGVFQAVLAVPTIGSATAAIEDAAIYSGNYLNWYFARTAQKDFSGEKVMGRLRYARSYGGGLPRWMRGDERYFRYRERAQAEQEHWFHRMPGTRTRLEIATEAALKLVDNLPGARVGFASLTSYGAVINVSVDDTKRASTKLKLAIGKADARQLSPFQLGSYPYLWSPSGVTNNYQKNSPLAAALRDMGSYFRGADGPANPGNKSTALCTVNGQYKVIGRAPLAHLFDAKSCPHCSEPVYVSTQSRLPYYSNMAPAWRRNHVDGQKTGPIAVYGASRESSICTWCQKNMVLFFTDGLYRDDGYAVPGKLAHFGEEGGDKFARIEPTARIGDGNDYLDNVAAALFDIDLRPDINDPRGSPAKNNVHTYTMGFPLDSRLPVLKRSYTGATINYRFRGKRVTIDQSSAEDSAYEALYRAQLGEQLLRNTASAGGGKFTWANDFNSVVKAVQAGAKGGCVDQSKSSGCETAKDAKEYFVYAGGWDSIKKYDSKGSFIKSWKIDNSRTWKIDHSYRICDLDTDSKGNVFAVYGTPDRVWPKDRGRKPITVLAKYDSNGLLIAERPLGGDRNSRWGVGTCPRAIAVDNNDHVWVTATQGLSQGISEFDNDLSRHLGSMGNARGRCIFGCGPIDIDFDRWNNMHVYRGGHGQSHLRSVDWSGNLRGAGRELWIWPARIAYNGTGSESKIMMSAKDLRVSWNEANNVGEYALHDGLAQFNRERRTRKIGQLYGIAVAPDGRTFVGADEKILILNPYGDLEETWEDYKAGERIGRPWGIAISQGSSSAGAKPSFIAPSCDTDDVGSGAPVTVDARRQGGGTQLFLTQYSARNWTGDLKSFLIGSDGQPGKQKWSAAAQLDSGRANANTRVLLTWGKPINGKNAERDSQGVAFRWNNLWESQQNVLGSASQSENSCGSFDEGKKIVDYLRGDKSNEGNKGYKFRKRESLLGAIVQSRAIYVGNPILAWPGAKYQKFKTTHLDRDPIIYVGANDGALHGFRAKDGKEVIGYFPASVFDTASNAGLHYFSDPAYQHSYLVDGTPVVSDAFIKSRASSSKSWRTVLVGTLRGGGRGLFALDVTNPAAFSEANAKSVVMWEFNNTHDAHLGYTFSEPTITLMNNGRWAAITGNGYEDTADGDSGGQAQLFIIYLDGGIDGEWTEGDDYLRISTGAGSIAKRNGLATPAVVDLNGDGTADRAYAGDLEGNLWAFDLSDRPVSWKVAYGTKAKPRPVFTARSEDGTAQPITVEPVVTRQKAAPGEPSPNLMVYFGTGKNILESDKTNTASQSFYAVWDRRQDSLARNALAGQKILFESVRAGGKGRVTDPNLNVDYQWKDDTHYGWYLDLPATGERVVSDPKVRGDTVFFNTTIPDAASCGFGGKGWMMSVATHNGGSAEKNNPVFDFDEDGAITRVGDTVVFRDRRYAYAGKAFEDGGAPAGPALAATMNRHMRYTVGDKTSEIDAAVLNEIQGLTGRIAWQQAYPEIAPTKHDAADTPEKREERRNK